MTANLSAWQRENGLKKRRQEENQAVYAISRLANDVKLAIVEKNLDKALANLGTALDREEPWATRTVFEAAGATGNQTVAQAITAFLMERFGTNDADEASTLAEHGRTYRKLSDNPPSPEEALESCMELLKSVLRDKPEWRESVIRRLREDSSAEVVNGEAP